MVLFNCIIKGETVYKPTNQTLDFYNNSYFSNYRVFNPLAWTKADLLLVFTCQEIFVFACRVGQIKHFICLFGC